MLSYFMKKKVLAIIGGIGLALIILFAIIYSSLTSASVVTAQLHIESGSVLVNGQAAVDDVNLKEGDLIETGTDSEATVILYESLVINLEPNTKITLDDLTQAYPKIIQEKGETWNKFTKLSGVTAYSIISGNTVASVRGTAFAFSKDKIVGGEGEVEFIIDGKQFKVRENRVVEKLKDKIGERDANNEEKEMINKRTERTIRELRRLREKQIEKHPRIFNMIKSRLNMDNAQIKIFFEDADEGRVDIDEIARKSPIKLSAIDKVVKITEKIREMKMVRDNSLNGTSESRVA